MGAAKPSIRLTSAPASSAGGKLQFGGDFALLPTARWPESNGCALPLLAQIDLTALSPITYGLPASGILSFFYDFEEMPHGGGHDRAGYEVIYTPDPSSAYALPSDTSTISIKPLLAVPDITVPPFRSIEMDALDFSQADRDRYWDFRHAVLGLVSSEGPVNRILGHPDGIQGCMQRTLQFETRGLTLPKGVYSWHEHPRAEELMPGAHDWRLLLQVDSDADLFDTYWGDNGRLFFWIHRDDLEARRFDRSWLVLQCY